MQPFNHPTLLPSLSKFWKISALGLVAWLSTPSDSFCATGKWDELIGKKVVNREGETLGHVTGSAIDLERGRYVGVIVSSGGFLGMGSLTKIVPPGAIVDGVEARTFMLNMDTATFRAAPTFRLSREVGPPSAKDVAEVYRYFGQQPYFTMGVNSPLQEKHKLEPMGYVQLGSSISNLPVENLQGIKVGEVGGLRGLNRTTGRLRGVVIKPEGEMNPGNYKIVRPEALRYNLSHDRLRLNDHEQPFRDSPDFDINASGNFVEEHPSRPGAPSAPPLSQGNSKRDKAITLKVREAILNDGTLSHYAKNIEVGTVKGKTIVRGRVETIADRQRVMSYATAAAGQGNAQDLLMVKRMSQSEANIDTELDPR